MEPRDRATERLDLRYRQLLKKLRQEAGLTQLAVAERLGKPQSYVSKYERGERRLDVLELRDLCIACGTTLSSFAARLEGRK